MNNIESTRLLTISKHTPPNPNFDPLEIKRDSGEDFAYNNNIANFIYHDVINSSLPKTYDGVIKQLVIECVIYNPILTHYLKLRGICITVDKHEVSFHAPL